MRKALDGESSASEQKTRYLPPEVQQAISLFAEEKWPGELNMQCNEMVQQFSAYCALQELLQEIPYAIDLADTSTAASPSMHTGDYVEKMKLFRHHPAHQK